MLSRMFGLRVAGAAMLILLGAAACSSTTSGTGTGTGGGSSSPSARPSGVASPPVATTSSSPSGSGSSSSSPGSSSPVAGPPPSTAPAPAPVHPVPAAPIRTATVHGNNGVTYVIKVWAETEVADCAGHAYGTPVINYLKAHPCFGLSRTLATTTVNGRAVGFSVCSLGFKGDAPAVYNTAGSFEQLVTADGTGSLNDLFREGYRLPSGPTHVPSPDAFDALGQDNGVSVYDAWYLSGATPNNDPPLVAMEQNIYLQF
jgi:hypothetical protein